MTAQRDLFEGLAHYHSATHHDERHEHGACVARLALATARCEEAHTFAVREGLPGAALTRLAAARRDVRSALAAAQRDNATVYFERVPATEALPPPMPTVSVQPVLPPELKPFES